MSAGYYGTRANWKIILDYLKSGAINDIRFSVCGDCGTATLYDKNGGKHMVTMKQTLDEVKQIVDKIRNG